MVKYEFITTKFPPDPLNLGGEDGVLGVFNRETKVVTISLSESWKAYPSEDIFIPRISKSLGHETLHHEIEMVLKDEKPFLFRQSGEEMAVRRMLGDEIHFETLIPYVFRDVKRVVTIEFMIKYMKSRMWLNLAIIMMLMATLFHLGITILKIKGVIP